MLNIEFQQPFFGFAFLLLPIFFFLSKKNQKRNENAFVIPLVSAYSKGKSKKKYFILLSNFIQYFSICVVIFALMQPIMKNVKQIKNYEGIEIILAMDCSNSMLATDLKPNRIEIAKKNAINFINKRKHDKIGITTFAGESFTISPLTSNYFYLKNKINEIKTGKLSDGTAIGVGISTALLRLSESAAESKIIILLTDGANNCGNISPNDAINLAKSMKIKIYTIAIGKNSVAKVQFSETEIHTVENIFDEKLLKKIAKETNAKFFHATNSSELSNIYAEIDKLETTPFTVETINNNVYLAKYLISLLILLFIIETVTRITVLKYI